MVDKKQDKKVVTLREGVTMRCCPGCGYLVNQIQIDLAVLNYKCPQCGKHRYSEFQPVKGN